MRDDLTVWLEEVLVAGINDLRGHDPAHEEDGSWRWRDAIVTHNVDLTYR